MHSTHITIAVDDSDMDCYVARPESPDPRGAVLVFPEIFGVNAEIQRVADLVASQGYVAIAPNYYHRTHPRLNAPYTAEGKQQGFAAARSVGRATLRPDIDATVDWLSRQSFVATGRIAAWGFCLGGAAAFLSATTREIQGAICFYAAQLASPLPNAEAPMIEEVSNVQAPLLLAFGADDHLIASADVAKNEAALRGAGKRYEAVTYPGVGHAFFRESSRAMESHAVSDSWRRVKLFLERVIG